MLCPDPMVRRHCALDKSHNSVLYQRTMFHQREDRVLSPRRPSEEGFLEEAGHIQTNGGERKDEEGGKG